MDINNTTRTKGRRRQHSVILNYPPCRTKHCADDSPLHRGASICSSDLNDTPDPPSQSQPTQLYIGTINRNSSPANQKNEFSDSVKYFTFVPTCRGTTAAPRAWISLVDFHCYRRYIMARSMSKSINTSTIQRAKFYRDEDIADRIHAQEAKVVL